DRADRPRSAWRPPPRPSASRVVGRRRPGGRGGSRPRSGRRKSPQSRNRKNREGPNRKNPGSRHGKSPESPDRKNPGSRHGKSPGSRGGRGRRPTGIRTRGGTVGARWG